MPQQKSFLRVLSKRSTMCAKFGVFLMVRISKQEERRQRSPKRCRAPAKKTGPRKENLALGYKPHANAVEGTTAGCFFIPKIM